MKRLRWIFYCAVAGGLCYLAATVPIGRSTLWERISNWSGKMSERIVPSHRTSYQKEPPPQNADQLTNDDRKSLDQLIEKKLEKTPRTPNTTAATKQ